MARLLLTDVNAELWFSAASIWEVVIKAGLGRTEFDVDPAALRRSLLVNGYLELEVSGQHALAISDLPDMHRDPFNRLLVAQAGVEGCPLRTVDAQVVGMARVMDLR